jgi:hypothetical protein
MIFNRLFFGYAERIPHAVVFAPTEDRVAAKQPSPHSTISTAGTYVLHW